MEIAFGDAKESTLNDLDLVASTINREPKSKETPMFSPLSNSQVVSCECHTALDGCGGFVQLPKASLHKQRNHHYPDRPAFSDSSDAVETQFLDHAFDARCPTCA